MGKCAAFIAVQNLSERVKQISRWVGIFYDEQMTAAMIDSLVHHSYLLLFDGQSNRVCDPLMKSAG